MTKEFKSTAGRSNQRLTGETEAQETDGQLENTPPEGESPRVQVWIESQTRLESDAAGEQEDYVKRYDPFAEPAK